MFPYQVEVLDQDCCCYSATNPSDHRFDLLRVSGTAQHTPPETVIAPTPARQYIIVSADQSDVCSWFPPFNWAMTWCWNCYEHLGWAFIPPSSPVSVDAAGDNVYPPVSREQVSFISLIFTRLEPTTVKLSAFLNAGLPPSFHTDDLDMHRRITERLDAAAVGPRTIRIDLLIELLHSVPEEARLGLLEQLGLDGQMLDILTAISAGRDEQEDDDEISGSDGDSDRNEGTDSG